MPNNFDGNMVSDQLKYNGIAEIAKIRKMGFAVRKLYTDLLWRFVVYIYQFCLATTFCSKTFQFDVKDGVWILIVPKYLHVFFPRIDYVHLISFRCLFKPWRRLMRNIREKRKTKCNTWRKLYSDLTRPRIEPATLRMWSQQSTVSP